MITVGDEGEFEEHAVSRLAREAFCIGEQTAAPSEKLVFEMVFTDEWPGLSEDERKAAHVIREAVKRIVSDRTTKRISLTLYALSQQQ